MKHLLAGILYWLLMPPAVSFAQLPSLDSIRQIIRTEKPQLIFSLDNRSTAVEKHPVQISGIKLGLEWKKKYRAGLGWYGLATNVSRQARIGEDTVVQRLRMRYLTGYGEYAFYQNRKWEFSVPVHAGIGTKSRHYTLDGNRIETDEGFILVLESGINGHYRIIKYIGLAGGAGYRQLLLPNLLNTENLSGFYINLKLKIFLSDIYRDIFRKNKAAAPHAPPGDAS